MSIKYKYLFCSFLLNACAAYAPGASSVAPTSMDGVSMTGVAESKDGTTVGQVANGAEGVTEPAGDAIADEAIRAEDRDVFVVPNYPHTMITVTQGNQVVRIPALTTHARYKHDSFLCADRGMGLHVLITGAERERLQTTGDDTIGLRGAEYRELVVQDRHSVLVADDARVQVGDDDHIYNYNVFAWTIPQAVARIDVSDRGNELRHKLDTMLENVSSDIAVVSSIRSTLSQPVRKKQRLHQLSEKCMMHLLGSIVRIMQTFSTKYIAQGSLQTLSPTLKSCRNG